MSTVQSGNGKPRSRVAKRRSASAVPETLDAHQLLDVLSEVRKGNFGVRIPKGHTEIAGQIASTLNEIIEYNELLARELQRVSEAVGREGRTGERASLQAAGGSWAKSVNAVNTLIVDLVQPTTQVARVIGAVAKGDLTQTVSLDIEGRPLKGEFLRIGKTVNAMVDQL